MERLFGSLLPLRGWPVIARYAATTLLVALSFVTRSFVLEPEDGHPFIFFVPAIIVVSVLFDRGNGLFACFLSSILAVWFFVEPYGVFAVMRPEDLLAGVVFFVGAIAMAVLIEALHSAYSGLHAAHSELGQAHKRLERAVAERDLLLSELSHRVKNDMMLLSASLHLQGKGVTDPVARGALSSAADRLNVLSRVHLRLQRNQRDADVDSCHFIEDLCEDFRLGMLAFKPVTMLVRAESHPLSLARAAPVGIVLNELVTNALKYAFPDERSGVLEVRFFCSGDQFQLVVADDGVGLKGGEPPGQGGKIVQALAAQLDGRFEMRARERGAEGVLCFPVEEARRA